MTDKQGETFMEHLTIAALYSDTPYKAASTIADLAELLPDAHARELATDVIALADEWLILSEVRRSDLRPGATFDSLITIGIRSYIHDIAVKGQRCNQQHVAERGRSGLYAALSDIHRALDEIKAQDKTIN